jgi:hypothetical protein
MQCEEVREQFADYVIDAGEGPERSRVAQHLKTCESCREEAEELKTLWMSLGSIPAAQPGPELRNRFNVMLEAYKHGLAQAPAPTWWQTFNSWLAGWWPRQPALQFGFALGLLALGVLAGHQFRSTPPAPAAPPNGEIADLRNELSQMRQLVAMSLMQQQSASDRLRGVNWSYQLQQPGHEILTKLVDTLIHDPNVNVRLATVDALRQFGDQPVVRQGIVTALSQQESPMVQIALIDLAVDLKEKASIGALRQITQDQKLDGTVRERAQKGLSELE